MQIEVQIFSCYQMTYKPIYKKILRLIYGNNFDVNKAVLKIINTSEGEKNIQSQRRVTPNSIYRGRIISIYENGILRHIVGISNTNYDEDRKYEHEIGKSNKEVSKYGKDNYHANTYLKQGINQIFKYYFENKSTADLSFYLLDLDKGKNYPNNLYNSLSYRELETIGFKVLNIEDVDFTEYETNCNSTVNKSKLKFPSINKYLRDIAYISNKNTGNNPSFLQCDEREETNNNGESTYMIERYTYTFKALSAQQYDSLLRCWCLKVLADQEKIEIDFKLGKQYFAYEQEELRVSDSLSEPVKEIFQLAGLNIEYTTNEQFMDEKYRANNTYLRYKNANKIRNQILFRNNIRKKGIPMECAICGKYDANLLDAAHIWEINKIQSSTTKEINDFIKVNNLDSLIKESNKEYCNEGFYKKYYLANSGDNGIWLCKNHHKMFDSNYYCFEPESGQVLLKFDNSEKEFRQKEELPQITLTKDILTPLTKSFLNKRKDN